MEKTINFSMNNKVYNALQAVKAKKDVRYYLNYICINLKTKSIDATDGYRALRLNNIFKNDVNTDSGLSKIVFDTDIKAPAKCTRVYFEYSSELTITFFDKNDNEILSFKPRLDSDCNYPDLSRVIVADNLGTSKIDKVGFNPNLLLDVSKALKSTITKFTFYNNSIAVTFYQNKTAYSDLNFTLMATKLND